MNKGMSNSMKVSFCCKDCKRKMFDYYAGILNLSIKCNRCKRVLTLKKIDEKYVAERMINGKLFVWGVKIDLQVWHWRACVYHRKWDTHKRSDNS